MNGLSAHGRRAGRSIKHPTLIAFTFLLLIFAACDVGESASGASNAQSSASGPTIEEAPASTATPVSQPTRELPPSTVPAADATPTEEPILPTPTATSPPTSTSTPAPTPTATNTPDATPTPQPTLVSRAKPLLIIPALNVDAEVVPVGLDANGAMAAPEGWFEVGWFRYGPRPGFTGSAALAGHLDTNTGAPATFWHLGQLTPGQEIIYQAEDGSRLTFVVEEVASYSWDEVPLDRVFARSGDPRLSLITCGGAWSRENRNYSHRTIVYASLR
jgi:sortase (surface protein transpeptidase)